MPQTAPPVVDALPQAPSTSAPDTFAALADAFIAALASFRTQLVALGANLYANAVDAYNNAVAAAASEDNAEAAKLDAIAAANAVVWVSGNNYVVGYGVYSPIDFQSYRCILDATGLTTDPSLDVTHWQILQSPNPSAIVMNYNLFGGL